MTPTTPRLVFAGTPVFAATHLDALIKAQHHIVGVYTQPDRPGKRGKKLVSSPVKTLALANDLPVYQPQHFKNADDVTQLAALKPDLLVVVAYGLILPQSVLDIPRIAPINVHGSLLPRWRGAAPIERAIEAGDTTTGLGIMVMEAGLDTGPILAEATLPINSTTTGDELRSTLASKGCTLLLDTLATLTSPKFDAQAQAAEGVNYAHKLRREESAINWQLDAQTIHNKVRAFNSSNVTHFVIGEKRIKLLKTAISTNTSTKAAGTIIKRDKKTIEVQCGHGSLTLELLQMPGGKALPSRDILNGHAALFDLGTQLQ